MKKEKDEIEESINSTEEEKAAPKKKRSKKIAILILAVYLAIIAAAAVAIDGRHIRFYMTGGSDITVECGHQYEEPGVHAVAVGRFSGESPNQLNVTVSGEVDTSTPGTYQLEYSVRYVFWKSSVSRTVTVVDTTPPEITLIHNEDYKPSWLDGYEEEGYTANDLADGDLTDKVQREVMPDRIVYTVTDASGNKAYAEREPEYSIGRPEIILNGGSEVTLTASRSFTEPGFTAVDSQGNDLSEYVTVEGSVTSYTAGDYTLVYSITNSAGETVSAERTVTVMGSTLPDTIMPENKTIYLTFDDGPGPYTDELLDTLAKYGVKATFFVTCANDDYFDCVGRAFREGHSIGVHSASHNYYKIYDSEDAFFEDFNKVEDMIYEQTGSYTNLCRFPGGSSNTVSSFNPGIMSRLAESLENLGYKYFDWNVTSGDAGETTSTKKIIENIKEGCSGRNASIVLQHDIKDYSVAAVEQVINWGLNNGYTFSSLDLTSPAAHHTIFN